MTDTAPAIPTCPGCHFGCQLDDYQCARGEKLFGQWCQGETIPERRMPRPGGKPPAPAPRPGMPPFLRHLMQDDPEHRHDTLATLVTMLSGHVHSDLPSRSPSPFGPQPDQGAQVLEAIMRHEGAASRFVVCGRTSFDEELADALAHEENSAGTLVFDEYEDGTVFMRITDAGRAKLQKVKDEKSELNKELFSCLSDDEQAELSALLRRVMESAFQQ